ncbi:RNA polymerase sigma factor [Polyangium aurulentum]|uniref:RNA polymerase sigma factor n=1 Tax=Polyangium aurulentum TaxID=2567896 RepID=UPI00146BE37B|nr:sigma-70 family RNA polymerase sigma factor [Polyangium aurulentum]UQA57029.1 sigma-70 family RNA polymerase sigma factor [Polyangium aurulentum]
MKLRDDRVGALFREHRKAVRSALRRSGVAAVEVDDLVQNVFVVAQRRIAKLPKDAEDAKRWLLDAARKHAANWHRLYRHKYEVLGWDEFEMEVAAEPADPEAYLALRDGVWRALDELDESERWILISYHLGGETLQACGAKLGLTKSGSYMRLQAAKERMRELVRRYQADGSTSEATDSTDA